MKTIKEWFELVEDEKLRKELLENYDESFYSFRDKVESVNDSIRYGFSWVKNNNNKYWSNIFESEIKLKQQTPTKEEVIEHFKDAELIQCLEDNSDEDIFHPEEIEIQKEDIFQNAHKKNCLLLWTKEKVYAKILKYKDMNKVKNKEATHYEIWKDFEAIDIIKSTLTDEEYKGYLKGNILKYKLREKGQDESDKIKIKDYTNELNDLI